MSAPKFIPPNATEKDLQPWARDLWKRVQSAREGVEVISSWLTYLLALCPDAQRASMSRAIRRGMSPKDWVEQEALLAEREPDAR